MELKLKAAKEPNIEADDMDEEREGFTEEAFQFIKSNNDLSVITNIANASLYSVRNNCEVYSTKIQALTPCNKKETFDSLTYNSQMDGNVAKNNRQNREIEVILHADFYEKMLKMMGLKKYVDIPEEAAKLDEMLTQIGALYTAMINKEKVKVISLEVLISAMRIYKYEYSGINMRSKLRGVDFRTLDPQSIRIMNRLTKQVGIYQSQYQDGAKEGEKVRISQILATIFKGQIDKKKVSR